MKIIAKYLSITIGPIIVYTIYSLDFTGLVLYYPAIVSFGVGSVFLLTALFFKPCLIIRFARLEHKEFPSAAENYCKRLNFLWVLILYLNALVSIFITLNSDKYLWAFYNGFLSYVLLFSFAGLEYCYRSAFRKRIENNENI